MDGVMDRLYFTFLSLQVLQSNTFIDGMIGTFEFVNHTVHLLGVSEL